MAQTSDSMSFKDCKIEISTNGTTWTDISGFANALGINGGERQVGEVFTFDGDTAIIRGGKRSPLEITVKAVYTEGASDPFETVRTAYEAGSALYVRWSPQGGQSGEFQFTSDSGIVTSAPYPVGESGSADVVLFEFTVKTSKVTKSVVA